MSDEYEHKIEAKSADSSSGGYAPPADHIPAKEAPDQELYHAKSFLKMSYWLYMISASIFSCEGMISLPYFL